jgi:phage baseplate assembly protein W
MDEDRLLVERRVLGYGIATQRLAPHDPTRTDVVLAVSDGRRDLQLVEGVRALGQDLEAAFATGLGTDALNLEFGFDGMRAIAEEYDQAIMGERIRASAASVLVREPRVRRVIEVTLSFERPEGQPAARRDNAAVECVFETVLGRREQMSFMEERS